MSIDDDYNTLTQQNSIEQDYQQLSNPNYPVEENIVTEEQFTQEGPKKEPPGFMKTLEMIGTGAATGALKYTGHLMSGLEKVAKPFSPTTFGALQKTLQAEEKKQQKKYHGAGIFQGVGSIPAEVASTAYPLGKGFGALSTAALAAAKKAPRGLKTAAQYGTSAVGGAGLLAGLESQHFDPDKIAPFDQAAEAMKDPASYLIPMAGTKFENWVRKAKGLQEAKEIIPKAALRDVPDIYRGSTSSQKYKQIMFDSIPNMTGFGKRTKLQETIQEPILEYVQKLSGEAATKGFTQPKQYKKYLEAKFQKSLESLKGGESEAWKKVPMKLPVADVNGVMNDVGEAAKLLSSSGVVGKDLISNRVKGILSKIKTDNKAYVGVSGNIENTPRYVGKLTIGDVKELVSEVGTIKASLNDLGAPGHKAGEQLAAIRESLMSKIQTALPKKYEGTYNEARSLSKNVFDTMDIAPTIKKALYDETSAKKVIKSLMSEAEAFSKAKTLNVFSDKDANIVGLAKIAEAIDKSPGEKFGTINLKSFLEKTRDGSTLPEMLNTETYQAIKGMNKYLENINEAGSHQLSKFTAATGALAAGGAGYASGGIGLPLVAGGVAAYNALALISNRSPLKSLFSTIGKSLDRGQGKIGLSPSAQKYMFDKLGNLLTRAGYMIQEDGTLDEDK